MDGSGIGMRGALLFGWVDAAPTDVNVRGYEINKMTTTLVYTSLPINLPESGRLGLAPGLLRGKITALPKGGGPCGPGATTSTFMDGMEATMEYQIPEALQDYTITSLKISLQIDNPSAALRQFGIYDWQQEKWGGVNLTNSGTVVIPNPAAYINRDGTVRINLMNDQGNPGCYYVDMGLEAERSSGQGD
jgi:hypothetical protein